MINSFVLSLKTSLCDEACVLVLMAVIEGKGRPCPLSFWLETHLYFVISLEKVFFQLKKKKMGETTESVLCGNVLSSQLYKIIYLNNLLKLNN